MDNIGSTNRHYKAIANLSMAITLALLQAYLMLIFSGVDLFNFSMIENDMIRYVVQVFVQLFVFMLIYSAIYAIVKNIYCLHWIKIHKDLWIKGVWLHIHVKNGIRIGTVEIQQNFYTVKAEGHNICPKIDDNPEFSKKETTWSYTLGKIMDDDSARDFVGCYSANEIESHTSKDGIHILKILTANSGQAPNQMIGCFRDTCKVNEKEIKDVGDHAGQLYFYKLSPALRDYLYRENSFRYDLLASLHSKSKFAKEPYVIKLKECLEEYNFAKYK